MLDNMLRISGLADDLTFFTMGHVMYHMARGVGNIEWALRAAAANVVINFQFICQGTPH